MIAMRAVHNPIPSAILLRRPRKSAKYQNHYGGSEKIMSSKKSIYLSDKAEAVLGLTDGGSLSGRINSIIIRYGAIMAKSCPALAENEWMAIVDVLNSTWRDADSADNDIARFLWAEIADSEPDGLWEKWEISLDDLSSKIRAMTYPEQCAIIEVVCRFWQGHDSQEWESNRERMEFFGARISENGKNRLNHHIL